MERAGGLWRELEFCGEDWRSVERTGVLQRGLEVCGEGQNSAEKMQVNTGKEK